MCPGMSAEVRGDLGQVRQAPEIHLKGQVERASTEL